MKELVKEIGTGSLASPCGTSDDEKALGAQLAALSAIDLHISDKFIPSILTSAAAVR